LPFSLNFIHPRREAGGIYSASPQMRARVLWIFCPITVAFSWYSVTLPSLTLPPPAARYLSGGMSDRLISRSIGSDTLPCLKFFAALSSILSVRCETMSAVCFMRRWDIRYNRASPCTFSCTADAEDGVPPVACRINQHTLMSAGQQGVRKSPCHLGEVPIPG